MRRFPSVVGQQIIGSVRGKSRAKTSGVARDPVLRGCIVLHSAFGNGRRWPVMKVGSLKGTHRSNEMDC